jgi:hypothetical protein
MTGIEHGSHDVFSLKPEITLVATEYMLGAVDAAIMLRPVSPRRCRHTAFSNRHWSFCLSG